MTEDLEPLDGDALAQLAQLGPVRKVPVAARDRIWRAVEARVAVAAGCGGTGGGGADTARSGPLARSGLGSWVGRNPAMALVGALLVGGAVGAVARGRPEVRVVTVERPAPPADDRAAAASTEPGWTEVEVPRPSTTATPAAPHPAPSAPTTGQELAAESAILDVARTSIARGEADHAIAAVDRHTSAFPHGMLREEREALGVKALVLAGRGEDARARAARFRATYPESLFLPALESSLRSLP
jgi:hypothetical protein